MSFRFKSIINSIENVINEMALINFLEGLDEESRKKIWNLKVRIESLFLQYPFNPIFWIIRFNGIPFEVFTSGMSEFILPSVHRYEEWKTRTIELLQSAKESLKERLTDVFIVHGHDTDMRDQVEKFIRNDLGLNPIILSEQPNRGRTIIEKFERYSNVGIAIILFTPDDEGYSKKQGSDAVKSRARQNVVLELGFFIGKIGRQNVVVLYSSYDKGRYEFELPSDIFGVLYIKFDKDGLWKEDIIKELKDNGYEIKEFE